MIDRVVEIVELLCLGTNDLVQYLLAVDRDNEAVAKWFNTLNPAVTRSIKRLVETANNRGIPCIVCGEMAGSPFYVPLLIGLGASELSMNPSSIPTIQSVVSTIAFEEALVLAREVEACDTAANAESVMRTFVDNHWKHLLS
jgi:phosphoenolpyruvate-protein kinase (PTS system EI component)